MKEMLEKNSRMKEMMEKTAEGEKKENGLAKRDGKTCFMNESRCRKACNLSAISNGFLTWR